MRVRPALVASFAIAAFLFLSSLACLIWQPELERLKPFWEAGLILCPLLILGSLSERKGPFTENSALPDAGYPLFCGAVFYLLL